MGGPDFITPAEKLYRSVVRDIVLELLKDWTPTHLEYAIDKDVTLADFLVAFPSAYIQTRNVAGAMPDWGQFLTASYVAGWLLDNKPSFVPLLRLPRGQAWLQRNADDLKSAIWGPPRQITPEKYAQLVTLAQMYQSQETPKETTHA